MSRGDFEDPQYEEHAEEARRKSASGGGSGAARIALIAGLGLIVLGGLAWWLLAGA
jgi:hypothetical protein